MFLQTQTSRKVQKKTTMCYIIFKSRMILSCWLFEWEMPFIGSHIWALDPVPVGGAVWEGCEVVLEGQTTEEAVYGVLSVPSHLASGSVSLNFIFLWLRIWSLRFLPWLLLPRLPVRVNIYPSEILNPNELFLLVVVFGHGILSQPEKNNFYPAWTNENSSTRFSMCKFR